MTDVPDEVDEVDEDFDGLVSKFEVQVFDPVLDRVQEALALSDLFESFNLRTASGDILFECEYDHVSGALEFKDLRQRERAEWFLLEDLDTPSRYEAMHLLVLNAERVLADRANHLLTERTRCLEAEKIARKFLQISTAPVEAASAQAMRGWGATEAEAEN